jgi:hypothetical protein
MSKPTLPTICSGFVILLCLVVLIGWQFDLPLLRRLLPNAPQTTPLTVIMLLTLSLALLTVERISHNDRLVWVSRGLVGLALVVAVWTGMQYLFRLPDFGCRRERPFRSRDPRRLEKDVGDGAPSLQRRCREAGREISCNPGIPEEA